MIPFLTGRRGPGHFRRFDVPPADFQPAWSHSRLSLTPPRALLYTSPWWLDGKIDIKRLTRTAQPKTKIL